MHKRSWQFQRIRVIKVAKTYPWLLALLAIGPLLSAATLAIGNRTDKTTEVATRSPTNPAEESREGLLQPSEPLPSESEIAPPAIRDPLLSSVLLPLPPLLLPDLLLPPYNFPSFNSQRLDEELQIYSRYLRIYGPPDVLIVGSSRSLQGIDPSVLQESLATQGYPNAKVFNFGVNGATAQVVDVVVREVLSQEQLPKLIIWGDGLRAFNDGRVDITYREIVASPGYRRLQAGHRPIPDRAFYDDSPILTASINPAVANSLLADSTQQISSVLDMYGFQAISDRFDPATYYQQFPKVPGTFDGDYVPFGLGGEQTQATIAVAQYAKAQNIPLVIVNLPLTAAYMDSPRLRYEQRFRQHMQQLAQQEQFQFIDLVQHPTLIQNQYFADPSHINQAGAAAVARQLATDTTIPWNILKK
jgi:lysophospholipase L1-like esterase